MRFVARQILFIVLIMGIASAITYAQDNGVAMPKYVVGDSWTLWFADGHTENRSVVKIENDNYVFAWGTNLLRYYDRSLVLRRQIQRNDGRDISTASLNQRLLEFPLYKNQTWESQVETRRYRIGGMTSNNSSSTWITEYRLSRFKVLAVESTQIAAGTFGAVKIEEQDRDISCEAGKSPCEDREGTFTVKNLWYSPETKSIIKALLVSGPGWSDAEPDYEMISYTVR